MSQTLIPIDFHLCQSLHWMFTSLDEDCDEAQIRLVTNVVACWLRDVGVEVPSDLESLLPWDGIPVSPNGWEAKLRRLVQDIQKRCGYER